MEAEMMEVSAKPLGVQYDFQLDFPLGDPTPFYEFFSILREAGRDDLVFLHINSPGGDLETMCQVVNAINTTEATVVACAEGEVASAAAYVFFSCHAFQVSEYSGFLLHNGMGSSFGKPNDNLASAEAHYARIVKVIQTTLDGFFTKKEIKKILDGKEHYVCGEEVAERINAAMVEAQQEEAE